ncbi:MAG: hypothetical protein KAS53_01030 [Candidatus Cloacimonetes bacterium]|nr:hypothetical protein [Candidatus Cloacimonadota bacterium]
MVYIGVALIISSIFFTAWSLVKDKPNPKGIISLCLCTIFAGIFLIVNERATEIVIKEVGTIKMVVKQVRTDAEEIHNLRTYLDSMFTIDSSGQVQWHREQNIGNSYWGDNPGVVTTDYMTISGTNSSTNGFNWQIGGYNMLTITRDGDGAGDSDTPRVIINSVLELTPRSAAPTPAKEGLIYYDKDDRELKVYNGSSWKIVTND